MPMTEELQKVQDRAKDGLETVQTQVIEMNKRMAKALSKIVPESASLPSLPFAGSLPQPSKVLERGFDAASKVIEVNKAFAMSLAETWLPEKADADADADQAESKADTKADKLAKKAETKAETKADKPAKK